MRLYHWPRVNCLANYSSGDIIVMAEGIEEARQIARTKMVDYVDDYRSWYFLEKGVVDPDNKDEYDAFMSSFEKDLEEEPKVVDPAAVFIRGSE
jgi:hypothetical protein